MPMLSRVITLCCTFLALTCLPGLPAPGQCSTRHLVNRGVALFNQGEYAEAIEVLHEAERRMVDPGDLAELLGNAYLGQAFQALRSGEDEDALSAFDRAATYLPDDPRPWQGRAVVLYHRGQLVAAASAVETAIGLDPRQAQLFLLLGQVRYAVGQMEQAREALRQALDLGAGGPAGEMLAKVEREWRLEREMENDRNGVFQVSFADDGQSDLVAEILDVLDDAYAELGADLDFYPDVQVPVLLYGRREFTAVTRSPDWAGAVYDGKIRIPLGGLQRMTPQLRGVLFHEYAHVMMRYLGKGRGVPTWLNEGFAELAGRRHDAPPLAHLSRAVAAGGLLPWSDLADGFTRLPAEQVLLAYQQSYAFCRYLVDQFGWFAFRELAERFAAGDDAATAFAAAYADFGLSWPVIQAEWRASLVAR